MKVLAEYVMAGPKQASILCVVLGLLPVIGPWLSCAAIALVVLQLGLKPSMKVLPWAVMPGVVWLSLGDPSFLLLLLTVFVSALVLAMSRSLALSMVIAVSVSAFGFLATQGLTSSGLEQLNELMFQTLTKSPDMDKLLEAQQQLEGHQEGQQNTEVQPDTGRDEKLRSVIALLTHMAYVWAGGLTACLVLLLGRWWQSLVYKPGAFQQEFHALRMNWNQVLIIFVLMALATQGLNQVDFGNSLLEEGTLGLAVAPVFSIPILLSGVALVHGLIAIAGVSAHWLGLFYMLMLFVGHLVYLPLIVTALLDVVFDFRARDKQVKH
jgi:hypothetical protein